MKHREYNITIKNSTNEKTEGVLHPKCSLPSQELDSTKDNIEVGDLVTNRVSSEKCHLFINIYKQLTYLNVIVREMMTPLG